MRRANLLSGVLCLDSAARHRGWALKHQPGRPSVAVPRKRKVLPERREGVRLVYVDLRDDEVDGFATAAVRTVLDCAARLPFDEALAIADSALRCGDALPTELVAAAGAVPPRYRTRALRVARSASPLADNPFESVLRAIALGVPGLHVEPQVPVGGIGRPDLLDRRLGIVVEAESFEFHGRRQLLTRDCARCNAFVVAGFLVVRFSWEHVMFQPAYVARTLEGAVAVRSGEPLRPAVAGPDGRRTA